MSLSGLAQFLLVLPVLCSPTKVSIGVGVISEKKTQSSKQILMSGLNISNKNYVC